MEKMSFQVAQVEGPLDLILQLIAKHRLNIYDIQIDTLVQQYLNAIEGIQEDMESASEFLEMASRLVYIKTVALLPRHEEESGRLKAELTGELLEYQACKLVAQRLRESFFDRSPGLRSPAVLEFPEEQRQGSPLGTGQDLLRAYQNISSKNKRKAPPTQESFAPLVSVRMVSVQSCMLRVLRRMYRHPVSRFLDLFEGAADPPHAVALFLAVLELVKAGRLRASRAPDGSTQVEMLQAAAPQTAAAETEEK